MNRLLTLCLAAAVVCLPLVGSADCGCKVKTTAHKTMKSSRGERHFTAQYTHHRSMSRERERNFTYTARFEFEPTATTSCGYTPCSTYQFTPQYTSCGSCGSWGSSGGGYTAGTTVNCGCNSCGSSWW